MMLPNRNETRFAPGSDAEDRLRQLVRLRTQRNRVLTTKDEDRLLEDAVTQLGLPLDRARGIILSETGNGEIEVETDLEDTISDLLKSLAGPKKRLSRRDFEAVAAFHSTRCRRSVEDSRSAVKKIMDEEDIVPRRAGILATTRWHRRIKA